MTDQTQKAKTVKQRHEKEWLRMEEVTGVGVGLVKGGEIGILVSVTGRTKRVREQIPDQVEGIPVEVNVTGAFRAQ